MSDGVGGSSTFSRVCKSTTILLFATFRPVTAIEEIDHDGFVYFEGCTSTADARLSSHAQRDDGATLIGWISVSEQVQATSTCRLHLQ